MTNKPTKWLKCKPKVREGGRNDVKLCYSASKFNGQLSLSFNTMKPSFVQPL